eukprot:1229094-Rhodomonas_salina.4
MCVREKGREERAHGCQAPLAWVRFRVRGCVSGRVGAFQGAWVRFRARGCVSGRQLLRLAFRRSKLPGENWGPKLVG